MTRKTRNIIALMCLFITSSFQISASNSALKSVLYLQDSTEKITIKEAMKTSFTQFGSDKLNFGYSKHPYWIKYKLKQYNETSIVHIKNHYLEQVNFYLISDNHIIDSLNTGLNQNKSNLFKIEKNIGKTDWLYVKVISNSPLRIPIIHATIGEHNKIKLNQNTILGVFYGIFVVIILFCVFIALGARKKLIVYFILTFTSVVIYSIASDNLIPDNPSMLTKQIWVKIGTIFGAFIGYFYILFSQTFFSLSKEKNKLLTLSFKIIKALLITCIVLFIFWYQVGNRMIYAITPLAGIVLSVSAAYLLFAKKMHALRFYFIGSSLFILIAILFVSSNLGIINSPFLSEYGLKLGYLIQVFVFAIAIGDKYILDQKDFQNILKQKVEERTSTLENTVNQLKLRQQQLIHSEKMASVGNLTSGIAHELNNPLNFIAGGLTIIQNGIEENQKENELRETLNITLPMIQEGLDRSSKVVASLASFAYGGEPRFEKTNLIELIENTLLVLNSSIPTSINIKQNLSLNQEVFVKREGMHQLLFSIVENAIWAIKSEKMECAEIRISLYKNSDSIYTLSVFNSSKPISKVIMKQMFDPFYTTKEQGEGTGLGLSIANTIAKDHKGELRAYNIKDGIEFTFTAPINP